MGSHEGKFSEAAHAWLREYGDGIIDEMALLMAFEAGERAEAKRWYSLMEEWLGDLEASSTPPDAPQPGEGEGEP